MNNSIYIRRKNKVFIVKKNNILDPLYISAFAKNIEQLGYKFSTNVLEVLKTYSLPEIEELHNNIVFDMKKTLGLNVCFKPMYPNFPRQVIEMDKSELEKNSFFHYLGDIMGRRIMPKYIVKVREKLKGAPILKTLELGTIDEFNRIFLNLISSKTALSIEDKDDINWFISYHKDSVLDFLPKEIPLKENIAFIGMLLIEQEYLAESFLLQHCKTPTDILRVITALSGGDVSLAENTKFKNLKKKERRFFLSFFLY